MGEVEIVESGSLDELTNGWEQYGPRTRIMMLGARADRQALRNHGRTVAIEESAVSVFHRPREERTEIEAEGLNHAIASFQFAPILSVLSSISTPSLRYDQPLFHGTEFPPNLSGSS